MYLKWLKFSIMETPFPNLITHTNLIVLFRKDRVQISDLRADQPKEILGWTERNSAYLNIYKSI